jgi:hypothetical protein
MTQMTTRAPSAASALPGRFLSFDPETYRADALALEALLEDGAASRSERFRCGTALFRDDLPRSGQHNVLRVESGAPSLEPDALMKFADELQDGLPQRSIRVVDDERAAELRPGLAASGWVVARLTLMAPRRRPSPAVDISSVREVRLSELDRARASTLRREHRDLDSADQLLVAGAMPIEGTRIRAFASTVSNEVAAYAVARVSGDVAKLTEMDALVRSQGQGLGRAVIWGAVTALREDGVRLVVVEAAEEGWAKWIFVRLGFDDIGHTHRFVRPW